MTYVKHELDHPIDDLIARLQAIRDGSQDYPYGFFFAEAVPCVQPDRHDAAEHYDSHFIVGGGRELLASLLDETETFAAETLYPALREVPLDDQ